MLHIKIRFKAKGVPSRGKTCGGHLALRAEKSCCNHLKSFSCFDVARRLTSKMEMENQRSSPEMSFRSSISMDLARPTL